MAKPFDANQVPINVTLNLPQVNTILEGLGELPFKKVEGIYNGLREVALKTLQQAEAASKEPYQVEQQPVVATVTEEVQEATE